jgi:hypothetical protein
MADLRALDQVAVTARPDWQPCRLPRRHAERAKRPLNRRVSQAVDRQHPALLRAASPSVTVQRRRLTSRRSLVRAQHRPVSRGIARRSRVLSAETGMRRRSQSVSSPCAGPSLRPPPSEERHSWRLSFESASGVY